MAFSAATVRGGGGSGDGRSIRNTITQTNHGFQPGVVVRRDGVLDKYVRASSETFSHANSVGVVESVTANTFVVVYHGEIDFGGASISVDEVGTVGITDGDVYYLSSSLSLTGYLSPIAPTDPSVTYQPLLVATSSSTGIIINSLPNLIAGSTLYTPVGSMVPYGGAADDVPVNWALCAGDVLSKASYPALYSRIGDNNRIVGLENALSTIGGTANNGLTVKFAGALEDAPISGIGSDNIHSITTGHRFKLSWNAGADIVVANTTAIDNPNKTVTFQFIMDHPANLGGVHTSFASLVGGVVTPITIQTLEHGEVTGHTSTNFFLPDLRARTVFGIGAGTGLTSTGFSRGEFGGEQTHLMLEDEMPSHSHNVKVTLSTAAAGSHYLSNASADPTQATTFQTNMATTEATGNDEAFNMLPPYVAANWIIRTTNPTGMLIDECLPGLQGTTGTNGVDGVDGLDGANGVNGINGLNGTNGAPGADGDQGPQGEKGDQGVPGQDCVCEPAAASPQEFTVYIAEESQYNGTKLPTNPIISGIGFSTSPLTPTDFSYFKSVLTSYNTPFAENFEEVQHFNNLNPRDPAYTGELPSQFSSYITQPSEFITRDLKKTINLNIKENANSDFSQMNFIFRPGVYDIDFPFAHNGSRKITMGGAYGSVFEIPINYIKVIGCYSSTGATQTDCFRLNCKSSISGMTRPLVHTGNYTALSPEHLNSTLTVGYTSGNPNTGGVIGASGQTAGFVTTTLGIFEVVSNGWSGNSSFTLEVPHLPIQATASAPSGIPYNMVIDSSYGLSAMTIFTTIFNVRNGNGFLVGDIGSNVHIGTGSIGNTLEPIVIVWGGSGSTDANYPEKYTSNAVGIQTSGRITIGKNVAVLGFPTGMHVVQGGQAIVNGGVFVGNYNGIAADKANVKIKGGTISRNQFGVSAVNSTVDILGDGTYPTIFGRNGLAVAIQSSELKVNDVTTKNAMVVRQSPAIVAFNSASTIIHNMVADHPATWMGTGAGGVGATGVSGSSGANPNSYSVFSINSNISYTEPTLVGMANQLPVFIADNTNILLRTSGEYVDALTAIGKNSLLGKNANTVATGFNIKKPAPYLPVLPPVEA
jgi:microcystin-dependent protein